MAKKAGRKRNTLDAQAQAKQLAQGKWFWERRGRWLIGDHAFAPGAGITPSTNPETNRKPSPRRPRRQLDRAKQAIDKRYPSGVPDEVSTETVRAEIAVDLGRESQRLKIPNPSWLTVHRALGRSK